MGILANHFRLKSDLMFSVACLKNRESTLVKIFLDVTAGE
jgi:hypothetical protein